MLLIGLAGKTGSGKNYVAGLLEQRGFRALDLDLVAHRVLDTLGETIEEKFGPGLVRDGIIDRKELGQRVFSNREQLVLLESLLYPRIELEAKKWISEEPDTSAVIHAVNLHKTSLVKECDAIIWVKASTLKRRKRIISRA